MLITIVRKAKTLDGITWVVKALRDFLLSGEIRLSEISVRAVAGDSVSRGFVDYFLLQMDFKDFFLGQALRDLNFTADVARNLHKVLSDHDAYRAYVRALPGCKNPDNSWQVGYPREVLDFVDFVEVDGGISGR